MPGSDRSEWRLARKIVDENYCPNRGGDLALAAEVLRLRELAEVRYELMRAEKGYDVLAALAPRIDKLYMTLNAEARGDNADFDGDQVDGTTKWNRLIETLSTALAHWLAAEKWAALEHRTADELRASMAMVSEGAPL